MMYELEKMILPEFPRTMHLPLEPNATSDDKIASVREMEVFLASHEVFVEEKVDGANSGIALYEGQPLIRNRSHILSKNYQVRDTPAKRQFSAIWTWFYNNQHRLQALEEKLGFLPSVYGEWLYARHSVEYDLLPDWWVAYDIYNSATGEFVDPARSRELLAEVGFAVVPLVARGKFNPQELLTLRDGPSAFSTLTEREGVYLKASDGQKLTARYKMVAPWFQSDDDWAKKPLVKNTVVKR